MFLYAHPTVLSFRQDLVDSKLCADAREKPRREQAHNVVEERAARDAPNSRNQNTLQ